MIALLAATAAAMVLALAGLLAWGWQQERKLRRMEDEFFGEHIRRDNEAKDRDWEILNGKGVS